MSTTLETMNIVTQVQEALAEVSGLDQSEAAGLLPSTKLRQDLKFQDIDYQDLKWRLEESFGLTFDLAQCTQLNTVEDCIWFLVAHQMIEIGVKDSICEIVNGDSQAPSTSPLLPHRLKNTDRVSEDLGGDGLSILAALEEKFNIPLIDEANLDKADLWAVAVEELGFTCAKKLNFTCGAKQTNLSQQPIPDFIERELGVTFGQGQSNGQASSPPLQTIADFIHLTAQRILAR